MQTLEGTGSSGNGVKSFRTILNKTPQAEPQTSSETQRPASEAVSFAWRAYTRHQWVCGAFTLCLGQRLLDSLIVRNTQSEVVMAHNYSIQEPTNRAGNIQDEGSCSGQPASLCKAKFASLSCKDTPPNTPLLLHWKFA